MLLAGFALCGAALAASPAASLSPDEAPIASGGHAPSERADLAGLPVQIKRAALLIHRLTR